MTKTPTKATPNTSPTLYVMSLGPIPTGQGNGTIYMGLFDGQLIPSPSTNDLDAALAGFRKQVPAGTRLQCLPELAAAGATHGYTPTKPADEVLAVRAQLAFVLAHPRLSPRAGDELYPMIEAAAAFWAARTWERLPADVAIEVVVTGTVTATYEAAVMGAAGGEFGLALYPAAGSIAKVADAVDSGRPHLVAKIDSVSLTYDARPAFAARAIEAWCGLNRVPFAFGLRGGKPRPIEVADALALAVTLRAMSFMKGTPGEVANHRLTGGGIDVAVTVRLPDLTPVTPKRPARARRPRR